jgi:hypothetical protein
MVWNFWVVLRIGPSERLARKLEARESFFFSFAFMNTISTFKEQMVYKEACLCF